MGLVSAKAERLTDQEAQIVKESWAVIMQNPEENGKLILDTFFAKHAHYISAFPKFEGIPKEELSKHPVYKRHGLAIIKAIDSVIVNLHDDSIIKDGLQALGRQHGKKSISEQQFLELKAVILDILSEKFKLSQEGIGAWSKTFDVALNYISEGLKNPNP